MVGNPTNINNSDVAQIAKDGYAAVQSVESVRSEVMSSVTSAASSGSSGQKINIGGVTGVDISTGAGALVLDDYLQELSTVEQAAAQLVAAENKAQKQIHSVTGQG